MSRSIRGSKGPGNRCGGKHTLFPIGNESSQMASLPSFRI